MLSTAVTAHDDSIRAVHSTKRARGGVSDSLSIVVSSRVARERLYLVTLGIFVCVRRHVFSHPDARKFVHQNSPRSASRDPTCLLSRRPPPQQCSLGHFGSSHFPHMYIRKVHTVRTRYALYASYGKAAPAAQFSTYSTLGCHIPHAALNLLGSRTICPLYPT